MPLKTVHTDHAPRAIGPYSQAVSTGEMVFCSGQIPLCPKSGQVVGQSVDEQCHQVLKNLQAVLEAGGSSLAKVIKTTIYLSDMNDFNVVNEIYGSYFSEPFPARVTIQAARLPKDVLVEIDAIAKVTAT